LIIHVEEKGAIQVVIVILIVLWDNLWPYVPTNLKGFDVCADAQSRADFSASMTK